MKALGLVVSGKIVLRFSHCMTMEANDPRGRATFDPRDMLDRIYVKLHIPMLHAKYRTFRSCGFREKINSCFPSISLCQIILPGCFFFFFFFFFFRLLV